MMRNASWVAACLAAGLALCVVLWGTSVSQAGIIFSDNFDSGPSPLWGNERGSWTASGGVYYAQQPGNSPPTRSMLPFDLIDFTIDLDINGVFDGGIHLRSDASEKEVLLVTHGRSGTLYWHTPNGVNGPWVTHNPAGGVFGSGDNIHLRVEVVGNTYSAYVNHSAQPATVLVTGHVAHGQVGLYDFSGQTFDNVVLTPEPATVLLLGLGLTVALARRKGHRTA